MFNRLRAIFKRYAYRHMVLDGTGGPITDTDGVQVAYLDRVSLRAGALFVEGWSTGTQVRLQGAAGISVSRPDLARHDVAQAHGTDPQVGFQLTQPFGEGHFIFHVLPDAALPGQQVSQVIVPFSPRQLRRERRRLRWSFARQILRALPAAARWAITRDAAHRAQVKAILGLAAAAASHPLETRIFLEDGEAIAHRATWPAPPRITVVLPVYNALDLLKKCLDRVENHTEIPWRMVLIEDGSTDPAVRPFVRAWAAARPGRVELIENAENLGFIGAVNRGLSRAIDLGDHVVLLNSDALVPRLWAHRLLRPLQIHEDVASTTPLSNDAEILSVPAICTRAPLREGQGDAIDAIAAQFNPEATLSAIPTGVGFCMALHIDWLRRVPRLDEVFGRGYGEEVDWCQRVRALGGRHLGVPGLFVEHRGGESFGSDEKARLIAQNGAIVSGRYPRFDQDVQDFIAADPLVTPRLILAVAWAASEAATQGAPLPIYLAHSLGGGADIYLEERMARDRADRGMPAVVLRVGGAQGAPGNHGSRGNSTAKRGGDIGGGRWQLEVVSAQGRVQGFTDDFAFVRRVLALVGDGAITYSCGVGDRDPVTLPGALLELMRTPGTLRSLDVLVHDYFMVSPSYTLLSQAGIYEGPVVAGGDAQTGSVSAAAADPAHQTTRPDGSAVSLTDWQRAWGTLMAAADTITTFSASSRDLLRASYPATAGRIRVVPHALHAEIPQIERPLQSAPQTAPQGAPRVVAVLGNIGLQKGAALLGDLSRLMGSHSAPMELVMIGNVDPAYPPPSSVRIHGTYMLEELPALVARYGITDWLVPSIWPETFCYAVHEAIATGLPTYAFDIGAQGEAVRDAPNGRPVPFLPASAPRTGKGSGSSYGNLAQNLFKVMVNTPGNKQARAAKQV